jgi:hypothetical protein
MDSDPPPRMGRAVSNRNLVPAAPRELDAAVHVTHMKFPSSQPDENVIDICRAYPGQLQCDRQDRSEDEMERGL